MFIPGNANQFFNKSPADLSSTASEPPNEATELAKEKSGKTDCDWDHCSINYSRENKFFKGVIFALPVSIVMWAGIIWSVKVLFF